MNSLEDDIRAVLQSQAEAMHVVEPHLSPIRRPRAIPRQRPRRGWMLATAVVLLVLVTGVVLAQRRTDKPTVDTTTQPDTTTADAASTTISNGWVALADFCGPPGGHWYAARVCLVQQGTPTKPVDGDTGIHHTCPAFSPDGTRLAYGQATAEDRTEGLHPAAADAALVDAALVINDVTAAGDVTPTATIAVDDISSPPCAIWSADGRWVAFGAGRLTRGPTFVGNTRVDPDTAVDGVWVVDTETDDIRRLSGLNVTDIEWAPDATDLFIASDGGIVMYSVATDDTRPLGGATGVEYLALSPDGQTIAYQRRRPSSSPVHKSYDLWLMDTDGTGERILAADFATNGIGPVWSPDGDHIAYQYTPPPSCNEPQCSEQDEAVIVTVTEDDPLEPAGTQLVIPPPEFTMTTPKHPLFGTALRWYPMSVTWSPDGTTLLYLAWGTPKPNSGLSYGAIAVRVDGATPPVFLSDVSPEPGFPWLPFQSWGRVP